MFNYFPRKEELFFDLKGEGESPIEAALANRPDGEALSVSLRNLFRELMKTGHSFVSFTMGIAQFWRTVGNSKALSARARELGDEFSDNLARMLAKAAGQTEPDAEARLAATMLVSTWICAHAEALRRFERGDSPAKVEAQFVSLVERGMAGRSAALSGTAYV